MENNLTKRLNYGAIGEKKFESFCKRHNILFKELGFNNREGYQMDKDMFYKIPKFIKSMPDYMMIKNKFHFVECKMADKSTGTHVKIKEQDIQEYAKWATVDNLLFFICNKLFDETYFVEYHYISDLIANNNYDQGMYSENGKYYYKVDMEDIRRVGREI